MIRNNYKFFLNYHDYSISMKIKNFKKVVLYLLYIYYFL